jgi:hypothetical protein
VTAIGEGLRSLRCRGGVERLACQSALERDP